MGGWLAEAVTSATELARRRGQMPSTAHLLVALYRADSSVLALCAQFGLRDVRLVSELVFVDERPRTIELVIERAKKLATAMGMHRLFPLHVLHVLAHERHCAANRVLQRLDVTPAQLSQAALDRLEGASAQQPSAAPAAVYDFDEAERARRNHASTQRLHRAYVASVEEQRERARSNALWLGDEVEKRLPRRGARPLDRPPPTFADEVEAKLRRRH